MQEGEYQPKSKEIISEEEEKSRRLRPYKEVLAAFGERLSWHRLRRLLNTGRVKGEKRHRQGKRGFPWVWHTSQEAVKNYLASVKSPSEYGKMGGRGKKKAEVVV